MQARNAAEAALRLARAALAGVAPEIPSEGTKGSTPSGTTAGEPEADGAITDAAADLVKAAAEAAFEEDPVLEETPERFPESQAAAGSYQAARERASAGAAAAGEKFLREHAEAQGNGHDAREL